MPRAGPGDSGAGWGRGLGAHSQQTRLSAAEPVARLREELAPLIPAAQAQLGAPGLSLVLADRSQLLWCEGFGVAAAGSARPVTPHTRCRAGSLAKPLTAAAILSLTEAGRLDIDLSLDDLLPELRIRTRDGGGDPPITPRAILCHHAGLPTDIAKGMWTDRPFATVLEQLLEEYLAFPPGLVFSYSNVGYSLLGVLIERASGQPFAAHLGQRLLLPLGMERTRFAARPAADPDQALGHRDGVPLDPLPIRDLPACGLETMFEPQSLSSHWCSLRRSSAGRPAPPGRTGWAPMSSRMRTPAFPWSRWSSSSGTRICACATACPHFPRP